MNKIAVVPASGIGDALIFHTLTHFLNCQGYFATTFTPHLEKFGPWFTQKNFEPFTLEKLSPFDAIFLQHDNSEKASQILSLEKEKTIYRFYGSYVPKKHGPLPEHLSYICNQNISMLENLQQAMHLFFQGASLENGLTPPKELQHKKYPKRIVIHPLSGACHKNWSKQRYVKLALHLQKWGWDPVFTVSSSEKGLWPEAKAFDRLSDFASFLYESGSFIGNDSGPGHLASYLKIPHLILGSDVKQLQFWRPSWHPGKILYPPAWSRFSRWSQKHWPLFLSTKKVLKNFLSLIDSGL